jgi:hypothetical protein
VPQTDAEVRAVWVTQYRDQALVLLLDVLYTTYRNEGLSVAEAYEKTLLTHLAITEKAPRVPSPGAEDE